MNGGIDMKIEKVEDLRKLRWRTLTEEEWMIIICESEGLRGNYVKKEEVKLLFEDKYREVARKSFLPIKETVSFLKGENYVFHKNLEEKREHTIFIRDVKILMSLLKIPEISDEQTVLQQFEQLTEKEKAHFVAEIWKDYIAPELLVRN